jgi:hypothetical protein
MHIRKDTAFTADEIRYLASFPLVTFEKGTGAREAGSTEDGTLAAARAVKKINPATKVLYYRNVIVHYGGYAANDALAGIPGALLVGRSGSDKLVRNRVQAYDLTNAKMRDWWLANAKQVCADPAIDGLLLDGNVKVLEPAYLRNEIGKEKKAELVDGYTLMMKDARRILGPEKLMVANVLRARFPDSGMSRLRAFDGSYMEGFEATVDNVPLKDYMAKGIAAFQQAARQGFGLVTFTSVNLPMRQYGWILRTKPARSTGNKPHEAHPGTSSRSAAGSICNVTRRNARRGQNQARHHLQNHGARSSPPRLDGQWRCGAGQVDSRCRNNDHQRDVH